jgi:hypothetical protein
LAVAVAGSGNEALLGIEDPLQRVPVGACHGVKRPRRRIRDELLLGLAVAVVRFWFRRRRLIISAVHRLLGD